MRRFLPYLAGLFMGFILWTLACSTYCSLEGMQIKASSQKIVSHSCCAPPDSEKPEQKTCQDNHLAFLQSIGLYYLNNACDLAELPFVTELSEDRSDLFTFSSTSYINAVIPNDTGPPVFGFALRKFMHSYQI